ncbi:MAG: acylneuraminate cytidylyltransferase family protein [Rhodospirillaceae bacterium]|jgi:CMP-N,N'-diacetyllegionaminic acid synthase|nr:acylneuraminate cytidylyltransferase family protein [Rhodospirillaceae bacterium]MBT5944360.1 acylneuraminate cytidylyltransferase family protein [Rhodospirillaceae bacterium]MBT6404285.1 acylneuraminate cytidylyltransferase family protein [Rhodospirillaceae bacterium]MBT6534552.1 acylneuraminate cytidylyltransferase family protein [Rhodospirillaceae bacterium]
MSWLDASRSPAVLAVIPARGGSKGIPGKNMKRLCGLTLVGRATRLAVSQTWVDQVIVSTDDPEIAAEVVRQGGDAPFLRPPELADDTASSDDMWRHAWHAAEDHYGRRFDVSILLEPTSPLRQSADLTATMEALFDGPHHGAATVSPTPAHYAPQKTLTVNEGRIGFLLEEGARTARRQDVPPLYHRNGLCYALRREPFLDGAPILDGACAAVIVDRPVANIDEPFELELAEWLLDRQGLIVPELPLSETA